jgi:hypothetical protein
MNKVHHTVLVYSFLFLSLCLIHSEHRSLSLSLSHFACACLCVCVCNFIFFLLFIYMRTYFSKREHSFAQGWSSSFSFFFSLFFILSFLPLLDIQSLKTQNIEMITFHYLLKDIEPATKLKQIISIYIYIYAALMLSVFGVCLFVLCVFFFFYTFFLFKT